MGREIKFRAWDKANGKMLVPLSGILWGDAVVPTNYIQGVFDGDIPANCSDFYEGEMVSVSGIELMQFTGLLDKDGKEIYEGDILEAGEYWGEQDYATVLWNDRQLQWYLTRNGALYEPLRTPFADGVFAFEVVGNIYENQDLLPNQKER